MQPSDNNTYIIAGSGAEIARLIDQEHIFTTAMGGLFPEDLEPDIPKARTLLNIACGPGEWDCNVAFQYPGLTITGVDVDADMVKYAQAMADVRILANLVYEQMDIKKGLDYPDNSFDIVNGRLLFAFMDRESWPKLLKECYRVVKPGGVICLAEYETTITNSIALQFLYSRLYKLLADQDRTYSVDGHSVGICHMLAKLLKEAGFEEVVSRPFLIDASYGSPLHFACCKDTETSLQLLKPYLLQAGIEEKEYEKVYEQIQLDMRQEVFSSISFGLLVWGCKP
jgi:ubiquinone/menaquinone biosynthesis C-methylase UbiE